MAIFFFSSTFVSPCLINPSYILGIFHGLYFATEKPYIGRSVQLSTRPLNPLAVAVGGMKKRWRDCEIIVDGGKITRASRTKPKETSLWENLSSRGDLWLGQRFSIWKVRGILPSFCSLCPPSFMLPLFVVCTFSSYPFIRDFSTTRILFRWNFHWSALWS